MKRNIFLISLVLFAFVQISFAQLNNDNSKYTLFESLATPDSLTNATVKIKQDKRIELAVMGKTNNGFHDTSNGYRVQVFSSNTQRTAKAEAFNIEKQLQDEFPNIAVYVNYTSPFWKVRVGDFKTTAEAQAFREQIIDAFPNLKSETYVVKEQINISGSK